LTAVGFADVQPDLLVSGIRLQVDRETESVVLPVYPAVYRVEQRMDPFLASAVEPLTVIAGTDVAFPELSLQATDATVQAATRSARGAFTECEASPWRCPSQITELARIHDREAYGEE